jgi:predicted nucleic-acid-binding protein
VRALDTNVLVRYLVRDDPVQTAKADEVLAERALVTPTVLLETVWVLASFYRRSRGEIVAALAAVLDQRNVAMANETGVRWALERLEAGADFADMLHLVEAENADRFATFDRRLARKAGADAPVTIETLSN